MFYNDFLLDKGTALDLISELSISNMKDCV